MKLMKMASWRYFDTQESVKFSCLCFVNSCYLCILIQFIVHVNFNNLIIIEKYCFNQVLCIEKSFLPFGSNNLHSLSLSGLCVDMLRSLELHLVFCFNFIMNHHKYESSSHQTFKIFLSLRISMKTIESS